MAGAEAALRGGQTPERLDAFSQQPMNEPLGKLADDGQETDRPERTRHRRTGAALEHHFGTAAERECAAFVERWGELPEFIEALSERVTKQLEGWSVDETLVVAGPDGKPQSRPGSIGPQVDPAFTTVVVPFNDVAALEAALANEDIACVLAEPALTNIGIVLPQPGFHAALRDLTRRHGTLLVIDETHTICVGPGGATAAWGLDPDMFVIGKTIGGGMPVAAYGMTAELAQRIAPTLTSPSVDVSGVGGTLTGNALALAAVRATLSTALGPDDFAHMVPLATAWTKGVQTTIDEFELPWSVQQLGARAEYWFCPPPTHGAAAAAAVDSELDAYMHLFAVNRGVLLTPFHNMALMCPDTTAADVDGHTAAFRAMCAELVNG